MPDTVQIRTAQAAVQAELKARDMSLRALSELLGLTYVTITRAVSCQSGVTEHTINVRTRIADYLGLDAHEIWPAEVMSLEAKSANRKVVDVVGAEHNANLQRAKDALSSIDMTAYAFSVREKTPYSTVILSLKGVGARSDLREKLSSLTGVSVVEIWPALYSKEAANSLVSKAEGKALFRSLDDLLAASGMPSSSSVSDILGRLRTS